MGKQLFEHTSYDELDAEGRGRSRLLPLKLAIQRLKGKENKINVQLKTDKDYHIFYQQLVRAGSKISIPNARNEEIGPQKFEQCFELLGIEDSTDLQDLLADPIYREIFEKEGVKFSFPKETRNEIRKVEARAKAEGLLEEIGITYAGEGDSWEWGDNSEADFSKTAPEGRQIWVIRSHYYEDGFPCMFLYPVEGAKISDYSTALDKFYMNLSTDAGFMKMHVDTKKFNPLWVACPCYYDWFLQHPQPEEGESIEQIEAEEAQRAAEETDYDYAMAEAQAVKDRKSLKRLVESYGKEDVLKYVKHINERKKEERLPYCHWWDTIDDHVNSPDREPEIEINYFMYGEDGTCSMTWDKNFLEQCINRGEFPITVEVPAAHGGFGGFVSDRDFVEKWIPLAGVKKKTETTTYKTEYEDIPI